MTVLSVTDLTQTTLEGTGVFDTLMRANKVHLEAEFSKGRIKGTEYATVYLGSLEAVLRTSLEFMVQREQLKLVGQQIVNLEAEALNIPKQGEVLDAQICKLKAEYDLLQLEKLKSSSETALLSQKAATEKAQTTAMGVDDNSVIGKQKALYQAQADGFQRDAEQKATKILIDTWNVRKTTDPDDTGLGMPVTNAFIEAAVLKMKAGIGA